MKRTTTAVLAGLTASALLAACGDGGAKSDGAKAQTSTTKTTTLVTAPASARVDLAKPVFSHPTSITNPRFPISKLAQVIQLGKEGGAKARNEVTLLPATRVIELNGAKVETLESQFTAFQDGRVVEVAVDYFAQDDAGSVWYFGEEVTNYDEGVIADHDGTWIAGKDGPPGMIMPADPDVGDVYRPENIPGLVFEEVTVKAVDLTVDGPRGSVRGAIAVQELLMDGLTEDKTFAPGYGEFHFAVAADEEVVGMGLAVPTDVLDNVVPKELTALLTGANDVFDAAASKDWKAVSTGVAAMNAAWDAHRPTAPPPLLVAQLSDALADLVLAADTHDAPGVRQGAVDVAYATLDLELQHRSVAEVDLARIDRWTRQVQVDVEADDAALVAGDAVTLTAIWDRVGHTVDKAVAERIGRDLVALRKAAAADDLAAAATAAAALQVTVASV